MIETTTLQVSPIIIEIGVIAGIIIGVVQICLMVFRAKKKPVEKKEDDNEHV